MKHDDFGDRMKAYERVYTDTRISVDDIGIGRGYICAVVCGKNGLRHGAVG